MNKDYHLSKYYIYLYILDNLIRTLCINKKLLLRDVVSEEMIWIIKVKI